MASLEELTHEQLLEHTKKLAASDSLFAELLKSPDTREDTLRLMKRKNPNLVMPEIDTRDKTMVMLNEERTKREALEAKITESEIRARIKEERERVMRDNKLSADDMIEVEKIMTDKEKGVLNYAAAARVFKSERTVSEPTAFQISSPTYDMPDASVWAAGIGNKGALDKIFLKEATAAMNEVLKSKAA
jgi:hypothetical protein